MEQVALEIDEDLTRAGGHARVRLGASKAMPAPPPRTTAVQLRRPDERAPQLSVNGWASEPARFVARLIEADVDGVVYGLGPEVVDQIVNGTPVMLHFPDLGLEGRAIWPDISPHMGDAAGGGVLSEVLPTTGAEPSVRSVSAFATDEQTALAGGERGETVTTGGALGQIRAATERTGPDTGKTVDDGSMGAEAVALDGTGGRMRLEAVGRAATAGEKGATTGRGRSARTDTGADTCTGAGSDTGAGAGPDPTRARGRLVALAASLAMVATAAAAAAVYFWVERSGADAARAAAEAELARTRAALAEAASATPPPASEAPPRVPEFLGPSAEAGRVATALHDLLVAPLAAASPRGETIAEGMAAEELFGKGSATLAEDGPEALAEAVYWLSAAGRLGHHDALLRLGEIKLAAKSGAPEILEGLSLIALGATMAGRPIDLPSAPDRGPVPASTEIAVGLLGANPGVEAQRLFNWIMDKRYDRRIPEWSVED